MLIMFFIYKEQAFTLPVLGFSTLTVPTGREENGSSRSGRAREGAVSMATGKGGSRDGTPQKLAMMSAIAFGFMKPHRRLRLNLPQ